MKKSIWIFVVVLMIAILLMPGCTFNPPAHNQTTNTTRIIGMGDTVKVDYILRDENGTVLDQSKAPLTVKVSDNNGFIKGFTYSLMGHKVGDHYNVTVPPELGYGQKDPDEIIIMPLKYTLPLVQWIPMNEIENALKRYNFTISKNTTFPYTPSVNATILNVTDKLVWVKLNLIKNQTFIWNNFEQKVIDVNDDNATIKFIIENGTTYLLKNPKTGNENLRKAKVTLLNETTFMIDFNSEMKGKTLYFEIWIRDVE
ncbi:FKBP-type peptidyl-prolyl cis-trans isomerase [Candidatus Micrarchaeota archaeon]|nr:FKBP-type peptidyl-prolyl cis-trans isomerase [Candidatus Micrarchaeota archaeon]